MMLLNGQHWLFIGIQLAIMAVCIIVNLVDEVVVDQAAPDPSCCGGDEG